MQEFRTVPGWARDWGRARRFIGDIVVVIGYSVIGVVLFGFVVVDDGVVADVGDRFVVFVDGGVLG